MRTPGGLRFRMTDPLNAIALAFATLWGAVALLGRPAGDYGVETDFYGDFAVYARDWMSGRPTPMNGFRGPFYYLLLGVTGKALGDLFLAAKLLSVIAAAITLRVAGGLVRRLFTPAWGMGTALFLAASPIVIEYAYRACSDLVFLALYTGALGLFLSSTERPAKGWALAGLLAAAASLTRYNGAVLLPAAAVVAILRFVPARRAAAPFAAFLVALTAAVLPWGLFLLDRKGNPFWNTAYENVAIEVLVENPHQAQAGQFMRAVDLRSLGDVWSIDPERFLRAMVGNLVGHLAGDAEKLVTWPWAIVAAAGFLLTARSWLTRDRLAFLVAGALTYLGLLTVFYNERFMLPLVIFWAAAGGGVLATIATRARRVLPVATALFALAAAASSALGVVRSQDARRHGGMPVELPGLAAKARAAGASFGPHTPIAARKPHLGYYLGAPVIPIPVGPLSRFRESGAHYLLVSGPEVAQYPGLRPLWAPRGPREIPPGLRFVAQESARIDENEQRMATLYAIVDPLATRPPTPPSAAPEPVPDGLSRLDGLRLQLLRWYVRWNTYPRPESIVRRISETARRHPDVLLTRGDLALETGDTGAADSLYREALAARPGDMKALLSLASVRYLEGDRAGYERYLNETLAGADTPEELDRVFDGWKRFYPRADFSAALAPLVAAVELEPSRTNRLMHIYALNGLNRDADAARELAAFLRHFPDDTEGRELLRRLEAE
jgi:4-amino-4-deoxy-L-arabinose transferase-like glycosyltransferase